MLGLALYALCWAPAPSRAGETSGCGEEGGKGREKLRLVGTWGPGTAQTLLFVMQVPGADTAQASVPTVSWSLPARPGAQPTIESLSEPATLPARRLGWEGWACSPGAKDNFVKRNLIKEQTAFKASLK